MSQKVFVNLPQAELIQHALKYEPHSKCSANGVLCVLSYLKTGRSPSDKRVVDTKDVHDVVDWGKVNMPITPEVFAKLEKTAEDYIATRSRVYVIKAYAGYDDEHRLKIEVRTTRPYHALFMQNMLIVPEPEALKTFKPDYTILNAGEFYADSRLEGLTSNTCVAINFETRKQVILGTHYAGEMKKGILTIMMYYATVRGELCMHASANEDPKTETVSVFFGLSGTGKTTLSADSNRNLIGDDEHVWTDTGIYNIEGGCYAKGVGLTAETDPEIFQAVREGALAENVGLDENGMIDYEDITITENTRVSYPLRYIPNAKIPAIAQHPRDVVFLTNDAFGVLPPVSKLTIAQAMFMFVSGYTAKVAGTEMGIVDPVPTFSPCFGGPFLTNHPMDYAKLLAEKLIKHNANCWLVNTGWSGGAFGTGKRMSLPRVTRPIVDAINNGELGKLKDWETMPGWDLQTPKRVTGVDSNVLSPINTWTDKKSYVNTVDKLAGMFCKNFEQYKSKATADVIAAMPGPYRMKRSGAKL